jgi:hypothetical protein
VRYLARGGPLDGQMVEGPPNALHVAADAVADAFGVERNPASIKVTIDGWVYEFSADEPDVLIGRPMTAAELEIDEVWKEIRLYDDRRRRTAQLSPSVTATLKAAHGLLEGDECVAGRRDDVIVLAARGATAKAWTDALEALGPEFGCSPEDIPDALWETLG